MICSIEVLVRRTRAAYAHEIARNRLSAARCRLTMSAAEIRGKLADIELAKWPAFLLFMDTARRTRTSSRSPSSPLRHAATTTAFICSSGRVVGTFFCKTVRKPPSPNRTTQLCKRVVCRRLFCLMAHSELQFQSELERPGLGLGSRDDTEVRVRRRGIRVVEVGLVQRIEALCAELRAQPFGDREILYHR